MELSYELIKQIGYALGIGIVIGLERSFGPMGIGSEGDSRYISRERRKKEKTVEVERRTSHDEFMGLRTFVILSLTGFISALAGEKIPYLTPIASAAVALLLIAIYNATTTHGSGITTEISAFSVFILGMLCRYNPETASVIAVILTIILAAKRFTHQTISQMRRVELTDTLKFLAVIIIILPLLPNRALDPYNVFNPYKAGVLVILISGISFVGYFLTRILGAQKGLGLTGVLGGLTSSTAVTVAMSIEAKENPAFSKIYAFSTLAANATMFVRVLVIVALLEMSLFMHLIWPVGGMAVAAFAASAILWFLSGKNKSGYSEASDLVKLKNPFSIGPALSFAVFFIVILFMVRLAQYFYGDSGLYAAAGLSGLADVDAITLSISEQTKSGLLDSRIGSATITVAVVSNSIVKTGIAFYSGGIQFGKIIALALGSATLAGLLILWLI